MSSRRAGWRRGLSHKEGAAGYSPFRWIIALQIAYEIGEHSAPSDQLRMHRARDPKQTLGLGRALINLVYFAAVVGRGSTSIPFIRAGG